MGRSGATRLFLFGSIERLMVDAEQLRDHRRPHDCAKRPPGGAPLGTAVDILGRAGFAVTTGHVPYRVRSTQWLAQARSELSATPTPRGPGQRRVRAEREHRAVRRACRAEPGCGAEQQRRDGRRVPHPGRRARASSTRPDCSSPAGHKTSARSTRLATDPATRRTKAGPRSRSPASPAWAASDSRRRRATTCASSSSTR